MLQLQIMQCQINMHAWCVVYELENRTSASKQWDDIQWLYIVFHVPLTPIF